jgi:uncharacterized membrane protein (UPF0127 family)
MRTFAVALGLSLAACAGCEPTIEEPAPRVAPTPTAPPADASVTRPPPVASAPTCVRPTPEQPTRAAPTEVPAPGCPDDPGPAPTLSRGKVKFVDAAGAPTVAVEVAERDEDRQRGLMYRKSMPQDEGMIFVFERARKLSFWMRNTCIPLDMIFVTEDGTIVNIEENTPTLTDSTFPSGCPALYVVEVNAGWTRAHGVKAGQKIVIER